MRRVIICSDHRVGPVGLITCEVGTFGQVARHVLTLVGVPGKSEKMSETADQSR